MKKCEFAAAQLREQILSGALAAGQKLPSETQLCELFGVSRLSVRNALSMLQAQGLIETQKGRGSFVLHAPQPGGTTFEHTQFSRMDLFEFRRILETEIAGLAAQRADADVISHLYAATEQMRDAQTPNDIAFYDSEFHSILAHATHNEVIIRVFDLLVPAFQTMFEQNTGMLGSEGATAHFRIVSAVESRDSARAQECMRWHLNHTVERTNLINYGETP